MATQEDARLVTVVESPSATVSRILTMRCATNVRAPLPPALVDVARSQQAKETRKNFALSFVPCRLAADASQGSGMTSSLSVVRRTKTKTQLTVPAA